MSNEARIRCLGRYIRLLHRVVPCVYDTSRCAWPSGDCRHGHLEMSYDKSNHDGSRPSVKGPICIAAAGLLEVVGVGAASPGQHPLLELGLNARPPHL